MQPQAGKRHVAIQGAEQDGVAAFAAPAGAALGAAAVPPGPRFGLGLHDPALDGGGKRFAVRERQADVLGPLRRFLECGNLLG